MRRVVFIENAQHLSIPAQNALLKVLEEPGAGTVFILSVDSVKNILPTVVSRTQIIEVHPVSLSDVRQYFDSQKSAAEIDRTWHLSGGAAGLISAVLREEQSHPLKNAVEEAKKFLASKAYGRLLMIDRLSRDKEQMTLFLDALARSLRALQHSALKNGKIRRSGLIGQDRKRVRKAAESLQSNSSPKLTGLDLVLKLKI